MLQDCSAVALTFDDGPDPSFTPLVLDELERLRVRATFFLIGERARAHPELVRRIVAEGHAVGSHSQTHAEPGTLGWRVVADFRAGRRSVERAAGRRVRLFRPPKGYLDRPERVGLVANRLRPWLWSIDPHDWEPGARPGDVLRRLEGLGGGDVVLLHDGMSGPMGPEALDRSTTVEVLPQIVERARERRLELVALPGG
jgi:peptidoglycan/xylan/chitin deacetylase (PgdA/CDA1 family)